MVKLIFLLAVSFFIIGAKGKYVFFETSLVSAVDPQLKKKALLVLERKCNGCHVKKKRVVFSEKNMGSMALAIDYQVFEKMRMPKGKVKLLEEERSVLKKWIDAEKMK